MNPLRSFDARGACAPARRGGALAVVVVAAAMAVACGGEEPVVAYRLAEYVAVAERTRSMVELVPETETGNGRLVEGWSPASDDGTDRWAEGRAAHAEFDLPAARPTVLTLELRPYAPPGAPTQTLQVRVNDELLLDTELEERWTTLSVPLPAEALRRGANRLQLLFDHALVPARAEGGDDLRQLAARVRRLGVGDLGTPDDSWSVTVGSNDDPAGGARISVATDVWHAIWLQVPEGGRLEGEVRLEARVAGEELAGDESVEAMISIEPEAGDWQLLFDQPIGEAPIPFDIDLGPWAGELVRLQLGGGGPPTAAIRWNEPVVTAPVSAVPDAALVDPEPASTPEPELGRPDIFLIVLDAARADAFSPYGAERPTPAIAALAGEGTVFVDAYSSAPWTGQAIPGVFSGRYPEAHGVDTWGYALPETVPTLAEVVGGLGYHTVLWTQHAIYSGNRTLRRGFDEFVEAPREEPGVVPGPADLLLDSSPTFAVLHWLPPHGPYAPPPPFRGRYSGWRSEPLSANAQFLNRFPNQQDPSSLPEEHVRYVRDRYDEHVAYADDIVGRFVQMLREAGRYDDALIAVVSDHGEGFLEHGWFLHTRFVYEEVLRVPLVIKWPAGITPAVPRVSTPVSTIQLFPTLVDGLGIEGTFRHQAGSLLPLTVAGDERAPVVYFSSRGVAPPDRDPRPLWGLRVGDWKLFYTQADDRLELYDLGADPGELEDLAPSRPRLAAFLFQQANLQRRRNDLLLTAEAPRGETEQLSTETIERLRALGYIQ